MITKYYINKKELKEEIYAYIATFSILLISFVVLNFLNAPQGAFTVVYITLCVCILFSIISYFFSPSFDTIKIFEDRIDLKRKGKQTSICWTDISKIRKGVKSEKYTGKVKEQIVIEYYDIFLNKDQLQYLPMQTDLFVDVQKFHESYKEINRTN